MELFLSVLAVVFFADGTEGEEDTSFHEQEYGIDFPNDGIDSSDEEGTRASPEEGGGADGTMMCTRH